jgi:hypothetical protein
MPPAIRLCRIDKRAKAAGIETAYESQGYRGRSTSDNLPFTLRRLRRLALRDTPLQLRSAPGGGSRRLRGAS